jgi:hypothetical protein
LLSITADLVVAERPDATLALESQAEHEEPHEERERAQHCFKPRRPATDKT